MPGLGLPTDHPPLQISCQTTNPHATMKASPAQSPYALHVEILLQGNRIFGEAGCVHSPTGMAAGCVALTAAVVLE